MIKNAEKHDFHHIFVDPKNNQVKIRLQLTCTIL